MQAILGTGKTFFVFTSTCYNVAGGLCEFSEVLFISYTNSAKEETLHRIENDLGSSALSLCHSFTIHSFALLIVNTYRDFKKLKLVAPLDGKETESMINEIAGVSRLDDIVEIIYKKQIIKEELNLKEKEMLAQYEIAKNEKELQIVNSLSKNDPNIGKFTFASFDEILILAIDTLDRVDFDFIKFKYIYVDEGQDCSYFQQLFVIKLKLFYSCKITIVGDEGQDFFGVLKKEKSFLNFLPNSKQHCFINNRRCSKGIQIVYSKLLLHSIYLESKLATHQLHKKILDFRKSGIVIPKISDNSNTDVIVYSCKDWDDEKKKNRLLY